MVGSMPTAAPPGLTRRRAIPLAIGSVAGSGILFLPSTVYAQAGPASAIVWAIATFVCVPMLLMFADMVRVHSAGDGIESFVRAAFGDALGRCIPLLFIALVVVGLPASAAVAGEYAAELFGGTRVLAFAASAAVLAAAASTTLRGVVASATAQQVASVVLVAVCVALAAAALGDPQIAGGARPAVGSVTSIGSGVLLAFWAFAGFENLTFLADELRRPDRDFLPVSVAALATYGILTVTLGAAIAATVPQSDVDELTGLLQIAGRLEPRVAIESAVTALAVTAVLLNAIAWMWGVSRLTAGAAKAGTLPAGLAVTDGRGVPRRAIGCLTVVMLLALAVWTTWPTLTVDAFAMASSVFVTVYAVSILAYVRTTGLTPRSVANVGVLVVLCAGIALSGWRASYGPAALAITWAWQSRHRRTPDSDAAPTAEARL